MAGDAKDREIEELRQRLALIEGVVGSRLASLGQRVAELEALAGVDRAPQATQASKALLAPQAPILPPPVMASPQAQIEAPAEPRAPTPPSPPMPAPPVARPAAASMDWEQVLGSRGLPIAGALVFLVAMGFGVALAIERGLITLPVQFGIELAFCAALAGLGIWRLKDGSDFGQTLLAAGLGGAFLSVAGAHVFKGVISYGALIPSFMALGVGAAALSMVWRAPSVHLIGFSGALIGSALPLRDGDVGLALFLGILAQAAGFAPLILRRRPLLGTAHLVFACLYGAASLTQTYSKAMPWPILISAGIPALAWILLTRVGADKARPRSQAAALFIPWGVSGLVFGASQPGIGAAAWMAGLGAAAAAAGAWALRAHRRIWAAALAGAAALAAAPALLEAEHRAWTWMGFAALLAGAAWAARSRRRAACAFGVLSAEAASLAGAAVNFRDVSGPWPFWLAAAAGWAASAGLLSGFRRRQPIIVLGLALSWPNIAQGVAETLEPSARVEGGFWTVLGYAAALAALAALARWRLSAIFSLIFLWLSSFWTFAFSTGQQAWWHAAALAGVAAAAAWGSALVFGSGALAGVAVAALAALVAAWALPPEQAVWLLSAEALACAAAAWTRRREGLAAQGLAGSAAMAAAAAVVIGSVNSSLSLWPTLAPLGAALAAAAGLLRATRKAEWIFPAAMGAGAVLVFRAVEILIPSTSDLSPVFWTAVLYSASYSGLAAWRKWRVTSGIGAALAGGSALLLVALRMDGEAASLAQGGSMVIAGLAAMAGLLRAWGPSLAAFAVPVAAIWPGWSMLVAVALRRAFGLEEAASYSGAWSTLAFAGLAFGFAYHQPMLRGVGLGLFGFVIGKVFLVDLSELDALVRVLALAFVAVLLMAGGWLYVRRGRVMELDAKEAEAPESKPADEPPLSP